MGLFDFRQLTIDKRNFGEIPFLNSTTILVACVYDETFFFFGSNILIRVTPTSLRRIQLPLTGNIQACCATSGGRIIVFQQNQGFSYSDNFGVTWTLAFAATGSVSGMDVSSAGVVVAQAALGSTTYISNNFGLNWFTNVSVAGGFNNAAISQSLLFYQQSQLFIRVGLNGIIATTLNGINWDVKNTGALNTISGQAFYKGNYYFGTTGGQMWASFDSLNSFVQIPPENLMSNQFSGNTVPQITTFTVYNDDLYYGTSGRNINYSEDGLLFRPTTNAAPASGTVNTLTNNGEFCFYNIGSSIYRNLVNSFK